MASSDLPELIPSIILRVESMTVVINAYEVSRFLIIDQILPVPRAPRALKGITLVDGIPVFVVDVTKLALDGGATEEFGTLDGPRQGILCRADGEAVVLTGGQVRTVRRLRMSPYQPRRATELATEAAEWRGALVPVLSIPGILAAATAGTA